MASNVSPKKQKISATSNNAVDEEDSSVSWKKKCLIAYRLKVSDKDTTSEEQWQKYSNQRSSYVYPKTCDDCVDEGKENVCENEEDDKKYYDTTGSWMAGADHYGCYFSRYYEDAKLQVMLCDPDLRNSLYIETLGYNDDGDGPETPRGIEAVTILYSPTSSNYVKLLFDYYCRARWNYVEASCNLNVKLCSPGSEEKNATEVFVFKSSCDDMKPKGTRSILGLANLRKIQNHLFGKFPSVKRAPKTETAGNEASSRKRAAATALCKGDELPPAEMYKLILAASMFETCCKKTNCFRAYSWVQQDGRNKFDSKC